MQPRRLLLVRHATAADGPVDADRLLAPGGERQAGAIGGWLEQAGVVPDRALVSPARRARQTWELTGVPLEPIIDPRIYDNTVEAVLAAIREAPDDVRTLAVVGHNPSIGQLSAVLDGGDGKPAARQAVDRGFPTGGVAVFTLPGSFDALEPGAATLRDFLVPGD